MLALRYRRVSGASQEDNSSLEKQLDRINAHCVAHGYDTTDDTLYTEVMTGVESWRDRVELQKLLAKAEALSKTTQVVVVVDHPDRFARGLDLVLLVELLTYYKACVEFVQTKFENDDIGKIVLHLQSWSSKQEWIRIQKRTMDGKIDRVIKDHKALGSDACYGYSYDDRHEKNCYVYNDTIIHTDRIGTEWSERKVVEFCFQKVKEGWTLRKVADFYQDREKLPREAKTP